MLHSSANITIKTLKLFENQIVKLNGSLTYFCKDEFNQNEKWIFKCWMDYEKVATLLIWRDINLQSSTDGNITLSWEVNIKTKRLGASNLVCSISQDQNTTKLFETKVVKVIVKRVATILEWSYRITIMISVIFIVFSMGCGLERDILIDCFRKPLSLIIGFCSQFVFMPLISAALAKLTGIDTGFALGLLVLGCSPGGGASNIFTILFRGDLNLSMAMTFISSLAALFMMPLLLFIFSRLFIDPRTVKIPYNNIIYNLLQIVIPISFGLLFQFKYERVANILKKKVKLMGLFFLLFVFTVGVYVNNYTYKLMGDYLHLIPIASLLPWLGFVFGYIFAIATRRNKAEVIAISLETGFQNIGIALIVLKMSMPQPEGDLGIVIPTIAGMFGPLPLFITLLGKWLKKKIKSWMKNDRSKKTVIKITEGENEDLTKESLNDLSEQKI